MELKIYDKQGLVKMTVSPDNSSQWNHEVGVENVVTVNFTTWEFLVLEVGWYILVEGQRFSIKSEYRPKHIHDTKYTYNLKFYGREHDAQDILFCRLNQGEDDLESVFAYDGTPMDFLQKVVANMNRNTDGVEWKAGEAITANRQTINFNGLYCWDALGEIARAFGTEWWMDGEYLNISKCERGESVSLGYGQGLKSGLTQNENTNAVKWFTRLIPVGSSKNIDKNKYGYATLQLPGREKYIDINTQYGLKEYREEAAFSEIYPHRVGTISSVRSEERTNEETGNYTVYYVNYVKDSSLPFNPDEYMIGGEVIHMTFNSGALAGKDFEVNWNDETKEFEIINQYPDENTQLPGGNLVPSADDTYVLWNISMPDEYIRAAEQELKTAVDVYLAEYSKDISVYSGSTDYIYISKNDVPLLLGQRVQLLSDIYFGNIGRDSRITRVSRKLNNLNEATIECGNVVSSSWKSNVSSSINNIAVSQQNTAKKQESQQKEIDKLNVLSELWEVRKDSQGHVFLYTKYDIATLKGITMYADGGDLDLPSIFAGLPFDNQTIWLNPETGVIEVIGGTGGGSIDSIHWNNIEGKPSFATVATSGKYADLSEKPDLTKYALQSEIPSLSGYATEKWVTDKNYLDSTILSEELAKYVTIDEDETINGVKDFANGLMIDGLGITKLQDDVVYLDAHLVVRGGITMFGTGEDVDVPTIMDALSVDGVNLQVINGVLTFVGEATGGVADSVRWENVIGRPTLLSSFTDDVVAGKYLPLNTSTTNILTSSQSGVLNFKSTSTSGVGLRLYFGETNGGGLWYNGVQGMYLYNRASDTQLGLLNDGTPYYQDLTYNKRHLWHSGNFNPNNYLPLSGGTITGNVKISNATTAKPYSTTLNIARIPSVIHFWTADESESLGYLGFDSLNKPCMYDGSGEPGTLKYLLHTGNYSSYALPLSGGELSNSATGLFINRTTAEANPHITFKSQGTNIGDIGINHDGTKPIWYNYKTKTWNDIITSDNAANYNVGSATKLQTARTIWGQSFNGTGNVDGDLKFGGDYCIKNSLGAGVFHPYNNYTIVGYANCPNEKDTYIDGYKVRFRTNKSWEERLLIDETGNVGISVPATSFGEFTLSTLKSKSHFCLHHNNVFGVYMMVDYNSGAFSIQSGYQNQAKALDIALQPRGGKVGIGTIAPSCSLHVVGDILSTGGITMYSDKRKKTILNHVELSLKQIADAPLIEHYYNSDENKTTHVGSIAQYWAEMNDWFCKKDNEGFYTMEIQNAALASAISIARELVKYESKTDKKIRLLKKRIGELEDEIEKLKRHKYGSIECNTGNTSKLDRLA